MDTTLIVAILAVGFFVACRARGREMRLADVPYPHPEFPPDPPCWHDDWEQVRLIVTGEHVANLCSNCLAELPLTYHGEVLPA